LAVVRYAYDKSVSQKAEGDSTEFAEVKIEAFKTGIRHQWKPSEKRCVSNRKDPNAQEAELCLTESCTCQVDQRQRSYSLHTRH